jgi:hypothetical protein
MQQQQQQQQHSNQSQIHKPTATKQATAHKTAQRLNPQQIPKV